MRVAILVNGKEVRRINVPAKDPSEISVFAMFESSIHLCDGNDVDDIMLPKKHKAKCIKIKQAS